MRLDEEISDGDSVDRLNVIEIPLKSEPKHITASSSTFSFAVGLQTRVLIYGFNGTMFSGSQRFFRCLDRDCFIILRTVFDGSCLEFRKFKYLHYMLSCAVYCNCPCLFVHLFVCLWVALLQPACSVCVASECFFLFAEIAYFRKILCICKQFYLHISIMSLPQLGFHFVVCFLFVCFLKLRNNHSTSFHKIRLNGGTWAMEEPIRF